LVEDPLVGEDSERNREVQVERVSWDGGLRMAPLILPEPDHEAIHRRTTRNGRQELIDILVATVMWNAAQMTVFSRKSLII
jgi:hypothetical protein